ncbi:hypothetical protein [Cupriavidus sp. RAF12]|uniref:hypothetical protein n=1 Tax=Cupriavidus sp. RAF12 TaxID=3233050 RepID=UPI003F903360
MDALTTKLARLSRHAQLCAESLSAAAAAASDPQVRAVLAHRANIQSCAAAELAVRAGASISDQESYPPTARRRDTALSHAPPPTDAGELVLLRYAAQQAGHAATEYGALLREPLADPDLRLLLAHYYRGATELQRLLEQRIVEFAPSRGHDTPARRASPHLH